MNRVLRRILVCTFVVSLSSICASKAIWACGGTCGGAETDVKGGKAEVVKDPVCSMEVGNVKKAPSEEYKGKVYYFCSEGCKKTFKKDPASYAATGTPQQGEEKGHTH